MIPVVTWTTFSGLDAKEDSINVPGLPSCEKDGDELCSQCKRSPKREKVSRAVRQLFGGQLWELDLLFAIEALDPILAYSPPERNIFFYPAYDIRLLFYSILKQ